MRKRREVSEWTGLFNLFASTAVRDGQDTPEKRAALFARLVPGAAQEDYLTGNITVGQLRVALQAMGR